MKSRIPRIFGVIVTLVLLVSLFGFAVPVSAGTLAWSAQALPGAAAATGFTINAGTDVGPIAVAADGTIFACDPTTPTIFRSTDGGNKWTAATVYGGAAVVAIVVSPQFATDRTVVVVDATTAYKSTNGGVTFAQMSAALGAPEVYTSLAISPTFASDGLLIAGTIRPAAAAFGTAYVFGRPATFGWVQWDALFVEDVTSVAFSPNFPIDATVVAVGSVALTTNVHASVNWGAFDAIIPASTAIGGTTEVGLGTGIVSSSIALPSDYNASTASLRRAYVGVTSLVALDNEVFRVTGAAGADVAAAIGLNGSLGAGVGPTSIAYSGTYSAGTVFVGNYGPIGTTAQVYRCANPTAAAGWVWLGATKAPTGTALALGNVASLALAPDFATSNKIFAGTIGTESAVAVSGDGGVSFYETGMIDTVLNTIVDFQPSPNFATDHTIFMVTEDGGAGPESVWKTTDGGTSWVRALAFVTTANNGIVRFSPNFATDQCAYFADIGGTRLWKTVNAGVTWAPYAYVPTAAAARIGALVVEDASTIYVGGTAAGVAEVKKSTSSGWVWNTAATGLPAADLVSLARASNGDMLVGVLGGNVYRSIDAGASFTIVGAAGIPGANAASVIQVAFDANYATNFTIYAGDSAGAAVGIFRFVVGTDTAWSQISALIPAGCVRGIAVASNGTLYAADSTIAAAAAGGVIRSLTPAAAITVVAGTFERVTTGDGLVAGYTLNSLALAAGSNTLFAIENSGGVGLNRVVTYGDTLVTVSPELVSPAEGTVSTEAGALRIAWSAVTGATSYDYEISTRSDFADVTAVTNCAAPVTNARAVNDNVGATPIAEGTQYYWRVRVSTPVIGPWASARSVTTQLGAGTNAPAISSPSAAGTGPGGTNAPIKPVFNWTSLKWATGYEFQLATDPTFAAASLIKDLTGANALGSVTAYQLTDPALQYSTATTPATYYWRVRGITASAQSDWSAVTGFTTTTAPAATVYTCPQCGLQFDTQAELAAHIAAAHAVVEPAVPAYIYAIIGIGAVLIIAVLVLIVRARRP